jgi:hypothetical protein
MNKPKATRVASTWSMIISLIMLLAYFVIGQMYIIISAFAQLDTANQALYVCTNIGIYIGIVVMALGLVNIVASIVTLTKSRQAQITEVPITLYAFMMALLFALSGLNFVIFAILVIPMEASIFAFSHLAFALVYLPCALAVMKNYKKFLKIRRNGENFKEAEDSNTEIAE